LWGRSCACGVSPVSVTHNPVLVALFIALVNVAAIPLLFFLLGQFFSSKAALWATALYATALWMIVFPRKIWDPDLLAPFLIITFFFLFSAMRSYAAWKVYVFAVLLALVYRAGAADHARVRSDHGSAGGSQG
jgi:hypothetical protein